MNGSMHPFLSLNRPQPSLSIYHCIIGAGLFHPLNKTNSQMEMIVKSEKRPQDMVKKSQYSSCDGVIKILPVFYVLYMHKVDGTLITS